MLTRQMLNIRILLTNYDIITYFLNLAFCLEHFISIYIYIYLEKLPLYNGGNHHRGSSGRVQDMLTYYKTIYSTY